MQDDLTLEGGGEGTPSLSTIYTLVHKIATGKNGTGLDLSFRSFCSVLIITLF